MPYEYLNRDSSLANGQYSEAWRRVLWQLGDYVAIILRALNVRPREVDLLAETRDYVAACV